MNTTTNAPVTETASIVGTTLRIGRRDFKVTGLAEKGDCGRPVYLLEGVRGARYATMRNVNRPEIMFLVHAGARGFGIVSAYQDRLITDRNGSLEVL